MSIIFLSNLKINFFACDIQQMYGWLWNSNGMYEYLHPICYCAVVQLVSSVSRGQYVCLSVITVYLWLSVWMSVPPERVKTQFWSQASANHHWFSATILFFPVAHQGAWLIPAGAILTTPLPSDWLKQFLLTSFSHPHSAAHYRDSVSLHKR